MTPKQARFVAEYLVDLNGAAAARRAGYGKAERAAERYAFDLLKKPQIRVAIDEALARRAERVEVRADDVLRELVRMLRSDIAQAFDASGALKPIHEIPEDARRAISAIETNELWEGHGRDRVQVGVVRKVKFWPKDRAAELLGKHLGMFVERHRLENPDGSALVDGDALVRMAALLAGTAIEGTP